MVMVTKISRLMLMVVMEVMIMAIVTATGTIQ